MTSGAAEIQRQGPPKPVMPENRALLVLLIVLTATTGLVDAVSVLGLGRVFTANMTGNVVFLGFALAGAPGFSAARSVVALASFLAGAVAGGRLARGRAPEPRRWLPTALLVEAALLIVGGLTSAASASGRLPLLEPQYVLITLTGVAMGVRNATMRRLAVPDMTTTVLTLTLTGLGADSRAAGGESLRWARRLASTAAMLAGAGIGAVLVLRSGLTLPLLLTGGVTVVAVVGWTALQRARSREA